MASTDIKTVTSSLDLFKIGQMYLFKHSPEYAAMMEQGETVKPSHIVGPLAFIFKIILLALSAIDLFYGDRGVSNKNWRKSTTFGLSLLKTIGIGFLSMTGLALSLGAVVAFAGALPYVLLALQIIGVVYQTGKAIQHGIAATMADSMQQKITYQKAAINHATSAIITTVLAVATTLLMVAPISPLVTMALGITATIIAAGYGVYVLAKFIKDKYRLHQQLKNTVPQPAQSIHLHADASYQRPSKPSGLQRVMSFDFKIGRAQAIKNPHAWNADSAEEYLINEVDSKLAKLNNKLNFLSGFALVERKKLQSKAQLLQWLKQAINAKFLSQDFDAAMPAQNNAQQLPYADLFLSHHVNHPSFKQNLNAGMQSFFREVSDIEDILQAAKIFKYGIDVGVNQQQYTWALL